MDSYVREPRGLVTDKVAVHPTSDNTAQAVPWWLAQAR